MTNRTSLYVETGDNGKVQVWASDIHHERIIGQWDDSNTAVYEAGKMFPNAHIYDANGQHLG